MEANGWPSSPGSPGSGPPFPGRMDLGQAPVEAGVLPLRLDRIDAELPLRLGGRSHHQHPWRHITADQRASRHQGTAPHRDAIEHHRPDPDQAAILERGAMDHGPVADRHVGADPHRLARIAMQHGAILHIAALPHRDRGEVTTGYGQYRHDQQE